MDCSCSISVDTDDYLPEFVNDKWVKARKPHKCCECWREIPIGEIYRSIAGKWGGEFQAYKTCADCQSIIDQFFDSWTFEEVLWDLKDVIADRNGELNQTCISKLTFRAREMVCDMIEKLWEDREDSGFYD